VERSLRPVGKAGSLVGAIRKESLLGRREDMLDGSKVLSISSLSRASIKACLSFSLDAWGWGRWADGNSGKLNLFRLFWESGGKRGLKEWYAG